MQGTSIREVLPLLLYCVTSSAQATPTPSAASISAKIGANGPRAVVALLWNGHINSLGQSDWDRVSAQIWNGSADYIELAPKMAPGTDAGSSEELAISLAHALLRAPAAVLRVIDPANGPVLGVSRVCGVPFIEDTVVDLPGYVRAARHAVEHVQVASLQTIKTACLADLAMWSRKK